MIESSDHSLRLAERISAVARRLHMPYVFKASYDKANRSSVRSFRGPGLEQGLRVLERLRKDVYKRKFSVYGQEIHITLSIGLATFPTDAEIVEPEMLVYFADQALLIAKEAGRDRVVAVKDLERKVRHRLRRHYTSMPKTAEQPAGQEREPDEVNVS